jgi:hypothetical protein
VGNQMRGTDEYHKLGDGPVYVQMGLQETPLAKTDSKDKSRKPVHTIQPMGNTLPGRLG